MLAFLCYWAHLATYWGMVVLFDFAKDGPPTLDRKDYARVARAALWNQIFLTLPLGWLGLSILMYPMTPSDAQQAYDLPWLGCILLSDIYFYLTHRLLHTRCCGICTSPTTTVSLPSPRRWTRAASSTWAVISGRGSFPLCSFRSSPAGGRPLCCWARGRSSPPGPPVPATPAAWCARG